MKLPGGYGILRAFPTRGNIRLHVYRTAVARYDAIGGHTVISAAPQSIRIAFSAVFGLRFPGVGS